MVAIMTIDQTRNLTLEELVMEKDKLINGIKKYENNEIKEEELLVKPSPKTIYLCNLQSLDIIINELVERTKQ